MTILVMVSSSDRAWAEKRVALVIGNSNYTSVPKLPNPSRDAIAVGQMFREAGFDSVDVLVDVGNLQFKRALRKFDLDVNQADIAVIYYAGHGVEIGGNNYLIPVDAKLASDLDIEDETIRLDRVVSSADGASKLRVVILDACRDNPFLTSMRHDRKGSNRAGGLGKSEPSTTDTLIAYAAKAGSPADDGDGQHSPFATALLRHLTVPGLDIRLAFGRIRDEVMRATGSRQEPYVYGSLGGGNISLVPAPKVQQEISDADVKGDYELVAKIGTQKAWEVFLNTHKSGFYADLARVQMAALTEQQSGTVTRSPGTAGGLSAPANKAGGNGNMVVADVPPQQQPGRQSNTQEALEWNKIKDSTDPAAFEKFIEKYPDAPLAANAEQRLKVLRQAQREREQAQKAAEDARVAAEKKKAEAEAAKKREEEERRAKQAEAEQKAKAAEAERKAAEERQKAEQAERARVAAEAAARRAADEKAARAAEEARKKAEQEARDTACRNEEVGLNQIIGRGSVDDLNAFARTSTCERLRPQIAAALDRLRAEQVKREREAAQKAAEQARIEAEKKKAEAAATKQREDDVRRVKEAEAAEKARAAAAELAATKKREEEEQRAKAEEAERQAKAAEAKRRADQETQQRAAAEAAAQQAARDKQTREDEQRAKQAAAEQQAKAAEAARIAAEEKRKADLAAKEAVCNTERAKLAQIVANGSEGSGLDDLTGFARTVTCDRLGTELIATIDKFKAEIAARAAAMPNSPQLIQSAQTELVRLGCELPGKRTGELNDPTKVALTRFLTLKGRSSEELQVTTALVADLKKETERVCPLECKRNEVVKDNKCVAPVVSSRQKDEDASPRRKQTEKRQAEPERRQAEREPRRAAPTPEPHVRQQAFVPRVSGGGGGGGGGTMIGVGF